MMEPVSVPVRIAGIYRGARVVMTTDGQEHFGRATILLDLEGWVHVDFEDGGFGPVPLDELDLLLDSPLAVCHVSCWIAGRRGVSVENWATFELIPDAYTDPDGRIKRRFSTDRYRLQADGRTVAVFLDTSLDVHSAWAREKVVFVPGLGSGRTYAEALRLACLAVGAASV